MGFSGFGTPCEVHHGMISGSYSFRSFCLSMLMLGGIVVLSPSRQHLTPRHSFAPRATRASPPAARYRWHEFALYGHLASRHITDASHIDRLTLPALTRTVSGTRRAQTPPERPTPAYPDVHGAR
ncbi:hypothetical protein BU26DRAFT_128367 [Trematosphaeria pertusa]|uniref:Uncharacterized protein n=1 Tax=Trematosphaeria pertusa TaxID=390896 RepID=A0A6A6HWY4_9PLEO|nr:uncharacterized protein BU26DRAFT_128367 [Trematosphaeria pertusa]KAF2242547.1 hypothetical protein BU26DRAFT_128367 [Trematosphaeria pertusa]